MNPKRVVLIEPTGKSSNVFSNFMQLPLTGLLTLGTILKERGHDVTIINENILGHHIDPFDYPADVYCVTCLTVTANRARSLAHELKRTYPNCRVIMGGIHASLLPESFTSAADTIVQGEAESVIIDIIEGVITDPIVQGTIVHNMDNLPFIDYSLLEGYKHLALIPVMTSRGCPFDCDFCTVTKIFGKRFRMQSVDRIIQEIQHALTYFSINSFFFYDDNFTANNKRIIELCHRLIDEKINITWCAQVRSDIARNIELVNLMVKAGCERLFIGFESIDDTALKAMHKSQTTNDIVHAITTLHNSGIKIHGMFIFGDDNDTVRNIKNTVDFAIKHDIDTVQFMVLTPFPGTRTYQNVTEDKRLFHNNWDYYDGMYAVFDPKNMSALQLQSETLKAYSRFYSLSRTFIHSIKTCLYILLDATVLNFDNISRYNLDTIFLRMASNFVVKRYSDAYNESYLGYLKKREIDQAH